MVALLFEDGLSCASQIKATISFLLQFIHHLHSISLYICDITGLHCIEMHLLQSTEAKMSQH